MAIAYGHGFILYTVLPCCMTPPGKMIAT